MTARTTASSHSFLVWVWDWTKSIVVALVVWFFLRTFLVEAFRIPSGSMENTLLIGDFLFVNKALYGAEVPIIHARLPAVREPARDDILVFDSVEEADLKVVKRLIGMPGDTLSMEGGQLYRNGQRVDEPYAVHADPARSEDPGQRAILVLHYYLELSLPEAAEALDIPVGTAKSRLHRSLMALRATVTPDGAPVPPRVSEERYA